MSEQSGKLMTPKGREEERERIYMSLRNLGQRMRDLTEAASRTVGERKRLVAIERAIWEATDGINSHKEDV